MNPENLRIGIGHDTHRLVPGGPLVLGGIRIDFDQQLAGHSDADVLLHAVTDALLGAAGLGDIGEMFPDHLSENKDRNSLEILETAFSEVIKQGFKLINLDCIVFAERPKLSPYKLKIAESIAAATGVQAGQVNVKAKTGEGVGPLGSGECMMAQCIALLYRSDG
ncbi:MAG: 2-C-methyl-D-erythritol 2,4-cyclodiphosphate synthase [Mariniblastus sp.]|nr:2-C-methyl-D-erythritol 2,4-cyclodiphosphate synthase [Mariniblastus sp.]